MVPFSELKKLETATIRGIRTNAAIGHLYSLQNAAHKAQIDPGPRVPIDTHLSFTLPIRLREDPGRGPMDRWIHLGCRATCAPNADEIVELTYSVLIEKGGGSSKEVARKFHFDFEPASQRNIEEAKPTFHLQMCGKLSRHHEDEGFVDSDIVHLLPGWSKPRIPIQPTSLALILDWLFIEFESEHAVSTTRKDSNWMGLVRSAERTVLRPYYEACFRFLDSTENESESFVSKHLYAES